MNRSKPWAPRDEKGRPKTSKKGRPSDFYSKRRKWTAPKSNWTVETHCLSIFEQKTVHFSAGPLSVKDRPISPFGKKICTKTVNSWDPVSFHHSYNLKIFEDGTDELKMDFAEVNDTKIIINSSKLAPGVLHELKIFSVDMTGRQSPPLSKLFETRKDTNSVENRFFIISRIATTN